MQKIDKYLENLIRKNNKDLTKTERKIADYFITRSQDIPFISIQDLAEKLNVGRASILRFVNKLGFNGFLDLKKEIKRLIQNSLAPMETFRNSLGDERIKTELIYEVAENEVNNINILINTIKRQQIIKAAKLISESNFVFTVGCDLSAYLAGITSYLLQRIGIRSGTGNIGGRSLVDQLFNVAKNDLLIAFSFPPYSPETIDVAVHAKKRGAKVMSVTNTVTASIVPYSDLVLQLNTKSPIFANSISAVFVLIYSIVYETALRNKERSKEAIDERIAKRG